MAFSAKEKLQVTITNTNGEKFFITQNEYNGTFFIYKDQYNGPIKLGKGDNPNELENKYIWTNKGEA